MNDPDMRISAKNRLIKRNKCVSCLCFVFGCASKTAVQAEPIPPSERHVYLEDEEGGESQAPALGEPDASPGFDNSVNANMSMEKLNNSNTKS